MDRPTGVARALRRSSTTWERSLWRCLRADKIGFRFRRQHPLAGYVLDFYCSEAKLCVELDGAGHARFHVDDDAARDRALADLGIFVLRLDNGQVGEDAAGCADLIKELCKKRTAQPGPLSE